MSWKKTAAMPMVATARAMIAAIGTPSMPQPVDADEIEAGTVIQAAMLTHRQLAHPLEDEELDLGDLRQVHQWFAFLLPCSHGIATRSRMSLMTRSVVRPWLAACGPSQMR